MIAFDLTCGDREWRVFEGVTPDVGWYARMPGSSPPVLLRAPTLAGVIEALINWHGRAALDIPGNA